MTLCNVVNLPLNGVAQRVGLIQQSLDTRVSWHQGPNAALQH